MAYSKTSFLANASEGSFYTGLNYSKLPKIKKSVLDKSFIITEKYNKRPDLLSYDTYGTPDYWWVFSIRNVDIIKDPINDFITGLEVVIPSPDTVAKSIRK
jgi:hypothetical protein